MRKPETLFTEEEKTRLAAAVAAAERETSGEIVPFVVGQSDTYPEAAWRAGTALSFLSLFGFSIAALATDLWLPYGIPEVASVAALAFAVGAVATHFIPWLKLLFVPARIEQQRVDERAALAFLSEQVFATRERTGILLFLSLLERRVCVLGDSGINALVQKEEWDGIVRTIIAGMKAGAPAKGLEEAIGMCGELLARKGVAIRSDDTDELRNALRVSDR